MALVVRDPPANAGNVRDAGSIPGLGGFPGGGRGYPLQCSYVENPMETEELGRAPVHRVAESNMTEVT